MDLSIVFHSQVAFLFFLADRILILFRQQVMKASLGNPTPFCRSREPGNQHGIQGWQRKWEEKLLGTFAGIKKRREVQEESPPLATFSVLILEQDGNLMLEPVAATLPPEDHSLGK